ncbi:MAG TPA: hypothetical protein VJ742_12310 [Nitrososphaera sp.]|nr:hypothetical protein [Nitrososphaera sp.]
MEKLFTASHMDEDDFRGMRKAIDNNQIVLALYHMANLINEMRATLVELQEFLVETKPAPRKKSTQASEENV